LVLSGRAREIAEGMGVGKIHLTITHTGEMAMAVVVMEG
jgi:holo-[acyl-carrier protein] synthase